jgi:2-methylcitrate dehydratase PrpD
MRELDPNRLPTGAVHQAGRCLLDLLGVALAGSGTPMAWAARCFARDQFAPGPCTVLGSTQPLSPAGATWANGIAATALDLDEGHRLAMGHPAANVFPAALAVAEMTGATGIEFLAACIAGYEIAVRASAARVGWYKERQYSTGIWGVLGAALAAGKLLGLDEAGLQSALGNAASHGPFPPAGPAANYSMAKEVVGWSGMTGCSAALLAQQGFVGPEDVFDYSGRWDTTQLVDGLGDLGRLAILTAYFKPHAVCRWAHASVDAALELMGRPGFRLQDVEAVEVETFYEVTRLVDYAPRTVVGAQFSIPFALALALLYGEVGPEQVSQENLDNPAVLALMRKVKVSVDPAFNGRFPAMTISRVRIHSRQGALETTVEYPRGAAENPLSDEELQRKFHMLADPVLGSRSRDLREALAGLPQAPDVSAVTRLLAFESH